MKKNSVIIVAVLIILGLGAYGFVSQSIEETKVVTSEQAVAKASLASELDIVEDAIPNFFLSVGTRFIGITKTELDKATAFSDFIGDKHANRIVEYKNLSVIMLNDNSEPTGNRVNGSSGEFNAEQLDFIKTIKTNSNILIWADYKEDDPYTGKIEDSYWTPHFTVVPEQQAVYELGNESFLAHIRSQIKEHIIHLEEHQFHSGIIHFVVSKEGTLESMRLQNSSGFSEIDDRIIEILNAAPGKWLPAINSNGEKVDQELVVLFGKGGC